MAALELGLKKATLIITKESTGSLTATGGGRRAYRNLR